MSIVAVDVGYGYTKACRSMGDERVCIPSVVAPLSPNPLGDVMQGNGPGHRLRIRRNGKDAEEHLVGEAAVESSLATAFLGREKPADMHDLLVLAAAYLAGAGGTGTTPGQTTLVLGLPLAYYRKQCDPLEKRLSSLAAWVSVDGGDERYISIGKVYVFPQGAGAVFTLDGQLPRTGNAAVVDVGYYTTDFVVFSVNGTPRAIGDASGSIEIGCSIVVRALAREIQLQTGAPLPQRMERQVLQLAQKGQPLWYGGVEIDLGPTYKKAVLDAARTISRQVLSAWGNEANAVSVVYLVGGGVLLLGDELQKTFPGARVMHDPVFANVQGYLRMVAGKV